MQMQIVDVRIFKHPAYCLFNNITFGNIGIDHIVCAIKCAHRQQTNFQNLRYFALIGSRLLNIFANKDRVRSLIRRIVGLMLMIDQNDCLSDFGIGEADTARETGVGVNNHPLGRFLCKVRIGKIEQVTKAGFRKSVNLKRHQSDPPVFGNDLQS